MYGDALESTLAQRPVYNSDGEEAEDSDSELVYLTSSFFAMPDALDRVREHNLSVHKWMSRHSKTFLRALDGPKKKTLPALKRVAKLVSLLVLSGLL